LLHPGKNVHHPSVVYKAANPREAHPPKAGGQQKHEVQPLRRLPAATTTIDGNNNNPYEGWQPVVDLRAEREDDPGCASWRVCFKENRGEKCAKRCRQDPDGLGPAPPRPGYVPDGSLSDEENAIEARKVPWVPDVKVLRRMLEKGVDERGNPWPPPLVTSDEDDDRELCGDIGNAGGNNDENKRTIARIPVRAQPLLSSDDGDGEKKNGQRRRTRVMCLVYTMADNHATNIRAIRETWGPGCDGFLAFSTRDDPRIPAISIPHDGIESYNNMWQKVRSIWRFVGTHYLEDFDFFFQGGEDLYVLPQNLRSYLSEAVDDPTKDDFFGGRRFQWGKQEIFFNSGGAGYSLSQATLRKLVETGLDDPRCFPEKVSSMEDVFVARCLKDAFGIGVFDTRDGDERERFHPFAPAAHYNWRPPENGRRDWYEVYNRPWPNKLKEMCCAPDSVSFHYVKRPSMARHLHALLYFCPTEMEETAAAIAAEAAASS